jgi:hypothetical protein
MKARLIFLPLLLMAAARLYGQAGWQEKLAHEIPMMGEQNWIVVADSAYPLQSAPGIEVVATGESQTEVLATVLNMVGKAPNVSPAFWTEEELPLVPEQDANGISAYRAQLAGLLAGAKPQALTRDHMLAKMEDASRSYHVLVLKSTMTLPYTAVFIQLETRYWSAEAETRLRAAMAPK